MEFVERIKKIQKEAGEILKKAQKKMKIRQTEKEEKQKHGRKKIEYY